MTYLFVGFSKTVINKNTNDSPDIAPPGNPNMNQPMNQGINYIDSSHNQHWKTSSMSIFKSPMEVELNVFVFLINL